MNFIARWLGPIMLYGTILAVVNPFHSPINPYQVIFLFLIGIGIWAVAAEINYHDDLRKKRK